MKHIPQDRHGSSEINQQLDDNVKLYLSMNLPVGLSRPLARAKGKARQRVRLNDWLRYHLTGRDAMTGLSTDCSKASCVLHIQYVEQLGLTGGEMKGSKKRAQALVGVAPHSMFTEVGVR